MTFEQRWRVMNTDVLATLVGLNRLSGLRWLTEGVNVFATTHGRLSGLLLGFFGLSLRLDDDGIIINLDDLRPMDNQLSIIEAVEPRAPDDELLDDKITRLDRIVANLTQTSSALVLNSHTQKVKLELVEALDLDNVGGGDELVDGVDDHAEFTHLTYISQAEQHGCVVSK